MQVFLGAAEGGLLPGIGYLLSRYYRRQELIFRIGFFLSLSPSLSGAFGGLLATGFLKTGVVGSIVRWRKIFLVSFRPPINAPSQAEVTSYFLVGRCYHHRCRHPRILDSAHLAREVAHAQRC